MVLKANKTIIVKYCKLIESVLNIFLEMFLFLSACDKLGHNRPRLLKIK
jgi:hypothetical protein